MRKTRHLLFKLMLVIAVIGAGYLVYLDYQVRHQFDSEQAEIEKRSNIRIFTEVFMLFPLARDLYFLLSEFFF